MEGARRQPLHPLIRDEVYRIGREALVNAFRHSGAAEIEVEVEYAVSHLRVRVRDDGRGIDDEVLRSGREGHWGLSGMRERAERIGARFKSGAAPPPAPKSSFRFPTTSPFSASRPRLGGIGSAVADRGSEPDE